MLSDNNTHWYIVLQRMAEFTPREYESLFSLKEKKSPSLLTEYSALLICIFCVLCKINKVCMQPTIPHLNKAMNCSYMQFQNT